MSFKLKVLINVIKRRLNSGESLQDVLTDYPKLTTKEIVIVETEVTQ